MNVLWPFGFQDDGSLSPKRRDGKIHSFELTLNTYLPFDQNEVIQNYFKDHWKINWTNYKRKRQNTPSHGSQRRT